MDDSAVVTHSAPVWREKADVLIHARLTEDYLPKQFEQLWVRRAGDSLFEVCCIPFCVYDLALGDLVEVSPDYELVRVARPSGHYTFRVLFGDFAHDAATAAPVELEALGAVLEWYTMHRLLGVDAPDVASAQTIADYLWERQKRAELEYETGRTA